MKSILPSHTSVFQFFFKLEPKTRRRHRKKRPTHTKERAAARALVHERLLYFNQFYNFSYQRVFIKNQKTRWGSCSKNGNLNFNYKIVHLPLHLADYIIVHELCHLGEFNHSKNFWALVGRTLSDYARRKKELQLLSQHGFHLRKFRSTINT